MDRGVPPGGREWHFSLSGMLAPGCLSGRMVTKFGGLQDKGPDSLGLKMSGEELLLLSGELSRWETDLEL